VLLGEIIGGKDFTHSYTSGKYDPLLLQWLYCAMQTFISIMDFSQSWLVRNSRYT